MRLVVFEDNVNGTPMPSDEANVGVSGDVAGEEESFAGEVESVVGNGVSFLNVLARESLRWLMLPEPASVSPPENMHVEELPPPTLPLPQE